MKNFNITSGKVNQSLINAMRIYKIKPTLKMTLSGAMNNPNLKAFDELTEKEKYSITALFCMNTCLSAGVFQLTESLN
ncbi:hypothetical protein [Helicobacter acinonychis]|uniref:hypothetical protein n=1 Tax=Helicobacter acinonychis TaxID=212 RepID=UPI000CF06DC7|nr:hypothetical protein [Helicobacter acinonychis]STP04007.1 Uncharacterised protein [Helicobacter acinonychis]